MKAPAMSQGFSFYINSRLHADNVSAQGIQFLINMLITPVNLINVVNGAHALRGEGGDEKGDAGTDVGGGHLGGTQLGFVVLPDDSCPVGVAKDYFRPHVD